MKTVFVLLLLLVSGSPLFAQVDWEVSTHQTGIGPATVFVDHDANLVHVMTTGIDSDFDGLLEPGDGDVSAGWYVYNADGSPKDSMFFGGFFNSYPVRVGVNFDDGVVYAPVNGKVASYSLETLALMNAELVDEAFAAVSYHDVSGLLILSRRAPDFISAGTVVYFDPELELVIGEAEAGINPGMSVGSFNPAIGTFSLYTVNEGTFGERDASLTYISYADNLYEATNDQPLGGGAADLLITDNRAYVLLGGTHQVRVLDVDSHQEIGASPIEVGTEGFDSPRAIALDGNRLFVGTYSSDIRLFTVADGSLAQTISAPGKVEDVAIANGRLFAAISYSPGTYDTDSLLFVADAATGDPIDTVVVGPGPAALFTDSETKRVLVLGYGAGTTSGGWWRVLNSETLEEISSGTMEISLSFPLRAAFDASANQLAVVGSNAAEEDALYIVDFNDSEVVPYPIFSDPDAEGKLFGVSDGGDYWLVTERPLNFAPAPCYVHMVRKHVGQRVARVLTTGSFLLTAEVLSSTVDGLTQVYILHEGNFGSTDALLGFAEYAAEALKGDLGIGANHILHGLNAAQQEVTAVTMNGGHEVMMLDLNGGADGSPSVSSTVSTETTGFDGPRETILADMFSGVYANPMFVSSYSGDVLLIGDGTIKGKVATNSKNEGIATLGSQVYVANAYDAGTFNAGTSISILSLILTSVDGGSTVSGTTLAQNYPNPVQSWTAIPFSLEAPSSVTVALYSVTGEFVAELAYRQLEAGNHELLFDASELQSGSYIYTLHVGEQTLTKRMEVVR